MSMDANAQVGTEQGQITYICFRSWVVSTTILCPDTPRAQWQPGMLQCPAGTANSCRATLRDSCRARGEWRELLCVSVGEAFSLGSVA